MERFSNHARHWAAGFTACALSLGLCLGGSASAADTPTKRISLHGAGATFPAPLYKKWIETYERSNPTVSIVYDGVGSGEGIARFKAGTVDFGASDAAVEESILRAARSGTAIPATAGMVVLIYNLPGIGGTLKLPREVLVDLLTGTVKRWNDPRLVKANPGLSLPNRNIAIVARQDKSGTTYALTNHLSAISPAWRNGPGVSLQVGWPVGTMLVPGNEGVAARVKLSEGAIGYVEYGFARRIGLPMAALENRAGSFVEPAAQSGQEGLTGAAVVASAEPMATDPDPAGAGAYPIVTFSWLLLYGNYPDAGQRDALKSFLAWGLTDGQALANAMGYIGLPQAVAVKAVDTIRFLQ